MRHRRLYITYHIVQRAFCCLECWGHGETGVRVEGNRETKVRVRTHGGFADLTTQLGVRSLATVTIPPKLLPDVMRLIDNGVSKQWEVEL